MITKSVQILESSSNWQQALAQAVRDPAELLDMLRLPEELLPGAIMAAEQFPLRVPLSYISRIEIGNPNDPLLRQILPIAMETLSPAGGQLDPVGDLDAMQVPGLIHKYHGRALLVSTGACGIHCRYCFRRHFPYAEANPVAEYWQQTMDYLSRNTEIQEIILSGGDPLSLSDRRLANMLQQLEELPNLHTVRLHTRLPVVLPARITDRLLKMFTNTHLRCVVVTHINHPNEIDEAVRRAMQSLKPAVSSLLNQTVLLAGINDSVEVLTNLSQRLFATEILPYYLHQFDPVQGAMHFAVPVEKGRQLMQAMQNSLPGYLVPRYVQESPGAKAKISL